ncbi:uracil-DNA glycosylase [Marinicella rhabdoformis]|uniref:uracil-DNA glycosylase n=1 Tax=Marinicella rhabdoformis TaxID=2580566 RepID=UPI0012AEB577|nr:uracil-DNA glycosylase [Marinicella rhabdoformis]
MHRQLEASWLQALSDTFEQEYMRKLNSFLQHEKAQGKIIYPPNQLIFNAFNSTPLNHVKVVILGQDPYHGPGQAHGLSFSVPHGMPIPPSLKNIFKEQAADLRVYNTTGNLSSWAAQGVLLLNSVLTVEKAQAASHQKQGWEQFTDRVISIINETNQGVVFMLWGAYAQKKGNQINTKKHLILKAPHPSPLSAHRGFLGCRHFSQANDYLIKQQKTPIDWQLAEN